MKPSYRNFNLMNSQDQMGIYKEMRDKGDLNFASVYRASNSGVYGKMYQLNNWYDKTNGMYGLLKLLKLRMLICAKPNIEIPIGSTCFSVMPL